MNWRGFLSTFGLGVAAPLAAGAEQKKRTRIGVMSPNAGPIGVDTFRAFRERLSELGYVEGQNLKQINSKLSRVAVFWDSSTPSFQLDAIKAGAKSMAIEVQTLPVGGRPDFEGACDAAVKGHAQAMVLLSSPLVSNSGSRLANLATARRLATISMFRENVTAGCLMAYGPSLVDGWQRLGSFAGRILNGIKPADLPVDRPTRFAMVINLKTAKALGLTIPQELLLRADEVIE